MNKMITVILILMSGLCSYPVSASHYTTQDLSVRYIGTDSTDLRYLVTLTLYKLCDASSSAVLLISDEPVTIKSVSLGYRNTRTTHAYMPEDTLDQLCALQHNTNSCYNPSGIYPGYLRRVYTDTVLLPGRANDYKVFWMRGNRNAAADNIVLPQSEFVYIEAGFNNAAQVKVSTPVFSASPVSYACVNQSVNLINFPTGQRGDSLETVSIAPLGDSTRDIVYPTGYSLANPIMSATGYAVNGLTGTASFTAMNTGKFVLAFRTNKYERATRQLISYTIRDEQIPVLPCASPLPDITASPKNITGATLGTGGKLTVNAVSTLSFDIGARNLATGLRPVLLVDGLSALTGAQFTVAGNTADSITGHFTWTPGPTDIGIYMVYFSASDTSCTPALPVMQKNGIVVPVEVVHSLSVHDVAAPLIAVYPNPAQDYITISTAGKQITSLEVLDMTGRILVNSHSAASSVKIGQLAAGYYLIKAEGSFGTAYTRFLKN